MRYRRRGSFRRRSSFRGRRRSSRRAYGMFRRGRSPIRRRKIGYRM